MSQRRTLILVAAIAIGALASFLVWNYVNGVQDEAFNNAEQVPVYLVKAPIPRGTAGLQAGGGMIVKENIPRKFKPSNAITSIEDISGKVAVSDLVPNQVVVSDMFVDASDPAARATFAERLTKIGDDPKTDDQVAISITVDQVHGVAGLIQPGDYVNIMMAPRGAAGTEGAAKTTGSPQPLTARYVYQKAIVLAVGQNAVPQAGAAAAASTETADGAAAPPENNAGLITLMVPVKAAQYIASLEPSSIYLTLVARDYGPETQEPIDPNAPLPAEDSSKLTPYGTQGPDAAG